MIKMNQNEHLYEFYGILMGDGCISRYYNAGCCIYFTKNNSEERYYPILEITSYSFDLITQLKSALNLAGFNVKISHYQDFIKLHGKENLFKWMELIGTSHPDKRSKFEFWRKYDYCPKIDELGYKERLDALGL